jgi:hypothetical protein
MRCPECGLLYADTSQSDRRLHGRVHSEVVHGPRRPSVRDASRCLVANERFVVAINSSSPAQLRKIAQDVSIVAAGDVDWMGMTYAASEAPDERNVHLFLGTEGDRIRAYMCVERRYRVWRCTWESYADNAAVLQPERAMWSVSYVWVCRGHRRKGWSRLLLQAAAHHLHFGEDVGWYAPFTPPGEAFVRSVCPTSFYIAR